MCGICGVWDYLSDGDLPAFVGKMTLVGAHRGPDDSGAVLFDSAGPVVSSIASEIRVEHGSVGAQFLALGHSRLSVIDLSTAGHQPMTDATGRYWMVYNGEIYNYVDLREELRRLGFTFRSNTDSEVVLQAFIAWGPTCLGRFNGMWSLAIYDRVKQELFCARDRFGVKPFHYACAPGRFAFGSEAKQLLVLPWVRGRINLDRLADHLLWGLENHCEETFFAGILTLPASHWAIVRREDVTKGTIVPVRYWEPSPVETDGEEDAIQKFRGLLLDSVGLRLRSDVPIGLTLSGGLDSSSVACLAGEHRRNANLGESFTAFNVEFEGRGYSERRFAEAAAARAGASTIVLHPSQEDLSRDWSRFVWHMEQPFDSLAYFSNFQIYGCIKDHGVSVVLSGQGGDELLLGYERYRAYEAWFQLRAGRLGRAMAEFAKARKHANMSLRAQLLYGLYFTHAGVRAARRRLLTRNILRPRFYREYRNRTLDLVQSMDFADRDQLQRSELFHYQLPHLLHHEDRVSMAHGVETRLPFLDYRLLELVLGQPSSLLFRDGWSKYLLRKAMSGVLPEEIRWRTDKMGYETPSGRLIRASSQTFVALLRRHRDDPVLNVDALVRSLDLEAFDERVLCSALSYLAWKEAFSLS